MFFYIYMSIEIPVKIWETTNWCTLYFVYNERMDFFFISREIPVKIWENTNWSMMHFDNNDRSS